MKRNIPDAEVRVMDMGAGEIWERIRRKEKARRTPGAPVC